jgi:hypothetical protein
MKPPVVDKTGKKIARKVGPMVPKQPKMAAPGTAKKVGPMVPKQPKMAAPGTAKKVGPVVAKKKVPAFLMPRVGKKIVSYKKEKK